MTLPLSTSLPLTLDLALTGYLNGNDVDDYCIEGLSHEPVIAIQPDSSGALRHVLGPRVDLLDGVDTAHPAVICLLDNILKCIEAEAIEALREDGDE